MKLSLRLTILAVTILMIALAGCAAPLATTTVPDSTPAAITETPAPAATSEPTASTPTTPPPTTAAPSTPIAPTVEILPEVRLEVTRVYSGGDAAGFCYLGGYAMLAQYQDPEIDFTDVIAAAGVGANGLYIPEANLLVSGPGVGTIGIAANNQGFDYCLAAQQGGLFTDPFLAPELVDDAKVITIGTEMDALDLLHHCLSSGQPVMVHLDLADIKEPLIEHTSYFGDVFRFQPHVDHYMVVTGYDADYVYLHDPTEPQAELGNDIPVSLDAFMQAWQNGASRELQEDARMGPYWLFCLETERGQPTDDATLLTWNRELAAAAVDDIRQAAARPNVLDVIHCQEMSRARREFAAFLDAQSYPEVAEMFRTMADLFHGLCRSNTQQADFERIADLQEQSLTKW